MFQALDLRLNRTQGTQERQEAFFQALYAFGVRLPAHAAETVIPVVAAKVATAGV